METGIQVIKGIPYYEENGTVYLDLETCARGLGFTTIAASGNEAVRWNTVHDYLRDLGVATSCNEGLSYKDRCPTYISESIFYQLCMKAKNDIAKKFLVFLAEEVLPAIRKYLQEIGFVLACWYGGSQQVGNVGLPDFIPEGDYCRYPSKQRPPIVGVRWQYHIHKTQTSVTILDRNPSQTVSKEECPPATQHSVAGVAMQKHHAIAPKCTPRYRKGGLRRPSYYPPMCALPACIWAGDLLALIAVDADTEFA